MKKAFKISVSFFLTAVLLFGSLSLCSFAAEDEIKRVSCTMYKDGGTGRGFCWYTSGKTDTDLQLVKCTDYDSNFSKAVSYKGETGKYRDFYYHKVAVTYLEAGTAYFYRVGDASKGLWSEKGTFVTDNGDDKFSFITLADVQASFEKDFRHSSLTAEGAYKTMPEAEFCVNLGDYVDSNTNEEWDWYFDNFKAFNSRFTQVPVAGNHDGSITDKLNTFCFNNMFCLDESRNQYPDGVYYSFDYGNAHFAVLNTNDMFPMSQAQRNWLMNDMSNTDAEWKIILSHRSLYSAGKNINKPDTIVMRNILIPIIDELGIDMVFSGHDHMYLRTKPVYGDEVTDTEYITEIYNGSKTTFALNPDGTVYTLPSTAGIKRYGVNDKTINPILSVADKVFPTVDNGGCFCTTEINSNKLIYKAYCVDDETQEVSLIDEFAIKKTKKKECIEPTSLDESYTASLLALPLNFAKAFLNMIFSYVLLLIQNI